MLKSGIKTLTFLICQITKIFKIMKLGNLLGVIFQLFNIRYQKIFNNENALWYIPKGKVRA